MYKIRIEEKFLIPRISLPVTMEKCSNLHGHRLADRDGSKKQIKLHERRTAAGNGYGFW